MNYYIVTNVNGNDVGEYGWIVEHDSGKHQSYENMIEVAELYSGRGATALIPRADVFEITEEQYNELSELTNKGEDTSDLLSSIIGPNLAVGSWIILTEKGLWGIDAYSFKTEQEARFEAMGDIYLAKEIHQLTALNIEEYQTMLRNQWISDSQLI